MVSAGAGAASGARASQATVYAAFCASASAHVARDFLCVLPDTAKRYGIEARTFSYGEAAAEVESLRRRYHAAGVGLGHRVALMLENRPAFFFHWLALNALGASVVPVNTEWRSAELEYLVQHSEVVAAVVPAARVDEFRRAAQSVRRDVAVTTPDLAALGDSSRAVSLGRTSEGRGPGDSVAHGPGEEPVDRTALATSPPDGGVSTTLPGIGTECALLYTSGTTGRPKGCVLPNEYFLRAGTWYSQVGGLCEVRPAAERLITPLPMSHMNAMAYSTMVMILTGGCIIPLDRFHPTTWWDSVRRSQATIVHYLGVMPAMLLAADATSHDQHHNVRFGFGAGVSPKLHAAFEARFGFPLLEAWAMTETGAGAVVIANREPRKVGTACFGRPARDVECRLVDDAGVDVAPGTPGELLVRASGANPRAGFFREYLKDAEATAAAWNGGYFHTGDVVLADEAGDLHFVDRKKNVIRRSGENISAVEVESVLLQHPLVAGAGVAAVPDEVRGDEVMACIVLREPAPSGRSENLAQADVASVAFRRALGGRGKTGERSDVSAADLSMAEVAKEIVAFCLQRLAYYKVPGYVAFIEQLPLTSTEKIQRARLKELAHARLGAAECLDLRAMKKRTEVA